jgi:hypothetical protein
LPSVPASFHRKSVAEIRCNARQSDLDIGQIMSGSDGMEKGIPFHSYPGLAGIINKIK